MRELYLRYTVFFVLTGLMLTPRANSQATISLAGGQEGGNYARLAHAIAEASKADRNIKLDILTSGGSVENLQLLQSRKADFALVQSDMVSRALLGHKPFATSFPQLVLVTPLFVEAAQVLIRSDLYIFTTSDLKGKTVSLGPAGSGTEVTARAVLDASGVSVDEIQPKHVALDQVYDALRNEDIDAAVLTSALPTPSVRSALQTDDARFLLLDAKVIERLSKSGSYFATIVPAHTYPGQRDDVSTIGVEAFLVTRSDVAPESVAALIHILDNSRRDIEANAGIKLDLLGTRPSQNLGLQPHVASEHYLRATSGPRLLWLALITAALAVILWLITKHRQITQSLSAHGEVLLATTALISVWAVASAGLFYYEHNVNENFATYGASLWSMLVYISGGFQSRSPLTGNGQIVSVLSIIIGVGVACWFTAELAGRFVRSKIEIIERLLRKNMLPRDLKDHIVIINWDARVQALIRQLETAETSTSRRIVVLAPQINGGADDFVHDKVYTCECDPTDTELLKKARVQFAHSITVVSCWCNPDVSDRRRLFDSDTCDAKTIMCLLSIRALCNEFRVNQVPVTAEIRSAKNLQAAQTAGGDKTEIICADNFGINLLAQCAVTPGLAAIYDDLLTFSHGTDEIYRIKVPASLAGKTFSEAMHYFAERRRTKSHSVIPIVVYRDSAVHLNPPANHAGGADLLTAEDYLFVISDSEDSCRV